MRASLRLDARILIAIVFAANLATNQQAHGSALKKTPPKTATGRASSEPLFSDDVALPQFYESVSPNLLRINPSNQEIATEPKQQQQVKSVVPSQRVDANQEPSFSKSVNQGRQDDSHWWALEDYYNRMRQAARLQPPPLDPASRRQEQQVPLYGLPYELQSQQHELGDSLTKYNGAGLTNNQRLVWQILANANAEQNPILVYPNREQVQQQQQVHIATSDFDPQRTLPVTRIGGLGGESVMLTIGQQPNGSTGLSQHQLMQLQQMILGQLQQQQLQWPSKEPTSTQQLIPANEYSQIMGQLNLMQLQKHPLFVQVSPGSQSANVDWLNQPEVSYAQRQYERLRHQYNVFGNSYNLATNSHELLWDAYCGPRNWIDKTGERRRQLSRKLEELSGWNQQPESQQRQLLASDLSDLLKVSEFPSHVGIYSGSLDPNSYLCAGTWIHESYALTYASCLNKVDPHKIRFRLGEWRLNTSAEEPDATSEKQPELVEGRVRRVHVSPWFREDTLEHNLALIEFERPINFLGTAYASPACQLASRSSLRASSCWAPTRNVTLQEYFDPSGEGMTLERKLVKMDSSPVRLVVRDEDECLKLTKSRYFIMKNPNYYCAGEANKKQEWRLHLNKTESLGSGVYCNEGGNVLTLVSIIHPIHPSSPSYYGYLDLAYYRPWIMDVIFGGRRS